MPVESLDHVNIITADLEGTARFYAELFGLEPRDGPPPLTHANARWMYDAAGRGSASRGAQVLGLRGTACGTHRTRPRPSDQSGDGDRSAADLRARPEPGAAGAEFLRRVNAASPRPAPS